jgi:ABC-type nickel/cobalt efflux system permease component RcnA
MAFGTSHDTGQNSLTLGLSLLAGTGLTVMMIALALGVVGVNSDSVGLAFLAGTTALIVGVGAWLGVVRPWEHFDDINIPAEDEHHGHDHHDDHSQEMAIVPRDAAHPVGH